jgi:Domain of unknown function (DUF4136)
MIASLFANAQTLRYLFCTISAEHQRAARALALVPSRNNTETYNMKNHIMQLAIKLAIAATCLALTACASLPVARAYADRSADFTQYKTFAFLSPLATDRSGYQSLVSQELKAATTREMEARGLRLDNNAPQLLINFNAALVEKTRVSSMPVLVNGGLGFYGGSYYGYRRGIYAPWPQYVEQTVVTNYKEGTLNIDVIDASRKQLVWEGVVTDSSVTQAELADLPASINNAVIAAFANYPVAAAGK